MTTKLNPEIWKRIKEINTDVNNNVSYVKDIVQYGKSEHWAYPESDDGDCE